MLGACGIELEVGSGVNGDGNQLVRDASGPGDVGPDGASADAGGATCDPSWPLAAVEPLPGLAAGQSANAPRLAADELTVYFARYLVDRWHVRQAERASLDEPFGNENDVSIPGVNDTDDNYWPSLSADGLVFSYTHQAEGALSTYEVHRAAVAAPFDPPTAFAEASALLFRVPGEDTYFISQPDGTGSYGMFANDQPVFPNRAGAEGQPDLPNWFEPRSQTLWFHRGGDDATLLTTTRGADGWSEPVVASAALSVTWVSADGCRLYGYVPGGASQLAVQRRVPPP